MLLQALAIAGSLYVAVLIFLAYRARSQEQSSKTYFMADSNLGALLGFFTFAATLFSTFTLLGMPDFFRTHGVGAWIFLAVSDAVMVFGIIWIGYYFKKKVNQFNYYGMSGFISQQYGKSWAGYIAFFGAFIFLTPYVAIQIRGVAIFLNAAFPNVLPIWIWASIIVLVMLVYSEVGGLKAIIYSDTMQGILLFVVIWLIGIGCLQQMGGLTAMFEQVEIKNPALLSVPGPKGLFTLQFLLSSTVAIALLPFTQPQISTRIAIMRDTKALYRMAVGLGFFAILIILPTVFLGMYGAILYSDASTADFLGNTLVNDQALILTALVMIGLIAAAISTSDSQIFALGGEIRSLLKGEDRKMMLISKICIFFFALVALVFAILSSDQLVLLARTSFAGTSLMAPMIFSAIFVSSVSKMLWLPIGTLLALLLFIASQFGWLSDIWFSIRLDLLLLGILTLAALVGKFVIK